MLQGSYDDSQCILLFSFKSFVREGYVEENLVLFSVMKKKEKISGRGKTTHKIYSLF